MISTIARNAALSALFLAAANGAAAESASVARVAAPSAQSEAAVRMKPRAVTLWWAVFNEPDNCIGNPGGVVKCNMADMVGPAFLESMANGTPDPGLIAPNFAARPAMLFGTGDVSDSSGRVRLVSQLFRNMGDERLMLPPSIDPLALGYTFDSRDAEIHVIVRDHGTANRADLLPQITGHVDPYCSDPNIMYFGGDNLCVDTHYAVFGADEEGFTQAWAFAEPGVPVRGATVNLMRDADALRVVFETRLP